mmetsp:Transcript_91502/g.262009  ORF Transcript_91502/g.262009 Transcript_91502/m.262009 type:complete len:300 (+) Transcript_91502:139-1038(+)
MSSEAQFDCPAHLYRHSHDDDRRTRLLKDVLRSTASLQEQEGKGKSRKLGALAMGPSPTAVRISRPRRVAHSTVNLQELSECQEGDELCLALVGPSSDDVDSSPPSPLLRNCGRRITGLCEKLQEAEKTLRKVQSETKLAATSDIGSESEIRIMDRPEESPAVVRARNDRVVFDFVKNHATFDKLEAYKDTVERAQGYEGLREVFPRRFQYSASMFLLNDTVLKDPEKLKAAIWAPTAVDGHFGGTGRGAGSNADLRKNRLQSRAAVGLKVNTNTDSSTLAERRAVARGMRKDRSAPVL